MGKYSCAIGPCKEKSYNKSEGVKFYHVQSIPEQNKLAVKRKILSTRKDISSIEDIKDLKICSRHFPNGDKKGLPTIIPKIVNGEVIWPNDSSKPRRVLKRHSEDAPDVPPCPKKQKTQSESGVRQKKGVTSNKSPKLSAKLKKIKLSINKTPPKLIQELEKQKQAEMDALCTPVKRIHKELFTHPDEPTRKSPRLSKKLQSIQKNELFKTAVDSSEVPSSKRDLKDKIILDLKEKLQSQQTTERELRQSLLELQRKKSFGVERFMGEPLNFEFYTGLADYLSFLTLHDFLEPERFRLNSLYYTLKEKEYVTERGRDPLLSTQNQLFLTLSRIRHAYEECDLGHRYDISASSVSDIFSKWIKHMSHMLTQLNIWPTRDLILEKMPECFKEAGYGETMCVIDCTEIYIEKPSNYALQSITWSSYKNANTAKALAIIAPHGPCIFVSDLYCGSASDHDITEDCNFLQYLDIGSHIMADKGFECQDLCDPYGVRIDHPPILRGVTQMSEKQEQTTRRIARVRIHVERLMERLKNNKILQLKVPITMLRQLNDIWKVCAYLTHWMAPLIEDGEGH